MSLTVFLIMALLAGVSTKGSILANDDNFRPWAFHEGLASIAWDIIIIIGFISQIIILVKGFNDFGFLTVAASAIAFSVGYSLGLQSLRFAPMPLLLSALMLAYVVNTQR